MDHQRRSARNIRRSQPLMVNRLMRSASICCLLLIVCVSCGAPRPSVPETSTPELFRFQVDFWPNLHQVLFHEALLPRPGYFGPKSLAHQSSAPEAELSAEQVAPWRAAVGYYDARFRSDSMFTPEFEAATRLLAAQGPATSLAAAPGFAEDWRGVLMGAAPVYRARFWPAHEHRDHAYIQAIRPLVALHGAWFANRLVAVYQTPWPPKPIEVQITPVVPPFGASTMGEPPFSSHHAPLILISSLDPGYSGDAGLEMLFHEASHLLIDKVQAALEASAKRQGRVLPDRFWHALLFYTAGHLTQERLGSAYVPYAERPQNHVFEGAWAPYLPILQRAWQPYLDGRVGLDQALDAVCASF